MKIFKALLWLTIILTFSLINLGGLVHNTGSSLACPDWPLCYGELIPKMEGGILIEHSHRLLGALVGIFSIALSFFSFKLWGRSSRIFKFSLLSLGLVIFQGILGGLTVIYKLPTIISTAHLGTSMLYFALLIYILFLTQEKESPANVQGEVVWNKSIVKYSALLIVFIYLQILVGASMRHLGLGGVCGTGWNNVISCFDLVSFVKGFIPESMQAKYHVLHRYFAYVIAVFAFYFAYCLSQMFENKGASNNWVSRIKTKSIMIPLVVISQVILGIVTVGTNLGVLATTLHLGGAALTFGLCWKTYLDLKHFKKTHSISRYKDDYLSDLVSMSKPRLSMLVIFTAGIGMFLAPGSVSFSYLVVNLFLITSLVAGACVLNCVWEKDIDKKMERTSFRPLPTGRISVRVATTLGVSLCAIASLGLFFYSNQLTALLGLIAAVSYVLFYTPLKQVSPHAVFVGAIPGAMPPLMGYTSVSNELGIIGLILFAILFVWQIPHFFAISLIYAKDYDQAGIKVFPNVENSKNTRVRILSYTALLVFVSVLPSFLFLTKSYIYLGVSLLLGSIFMYVAFQGLNTKREMLEVKWAKMFFFSTIIYLPLQLGLMINQIS